MGLTKAVVFDLDDTLFLEHQYVRSGFEHLAQVLSRECDACGDELARSLWGLFKSGVRGNTFDRLLSMYPGLTKRFSANDMVRIYRTHTPKISLLPGISDVLKRLRDGQVKLGLITDGCAQSQRLKYGALGLDSYLEIAVFTDHWGKEFWRPHPQAFVSVEQTWKLHPHEFTYVGDNPEKDFVAPNLMGWHTIRLRLDGQLRQGRETDLPDHSAGVEVCSVDELDTELGARALARS